MSGTVYGEGFAVIPDSVLYAKVSPTAKLLWAIFARHADPEGRSYPSRRRLAELMDVHEETVTRVKKELEKAGLIEVKEHRRDDGGRTSDDVFLRVPLRKNAEGPLRMDAETRSRTSKNISPRGGGTHSAATPPTQEVDQETPETPTPAPDVKALVAHYVQVSKRVGVTPTTRVTNHLAAQVKRLAGEGKPERVLRMALTALAKEGKPPGHLDYVVMDAERELSKGPG